MPQLNEHDHADVKAIGERLESIRTFTEDPGKFWPAFLEMSANLIGANTGFLVVRTAQGGSWKQVAVWSDGKVLGDKTRELNPRIDDIAEASVHSGCAWEKSGKPGGMVGVHLRVKEANLSVAVFLRHPDTGLSVQEAAMRLNLVADTPSFYELGRMLRQAKNDVVRFAEALDLMVLINVEDRYLAAAMTLSNEIASRYGCDRVSLGWLDGIYVRVQSISHMERFEKKMNVVQSLETAMEEAFDQNEEIVWPRPEGSHFVVRDHETFAKAQGSGNLASLPLRLDDQPVGVLTCERSSPAFTEDEIWGLRVLCDQAARRLGDLKHSDRWFGARMASAARAFFGKLLGAEHTFAKLVGLIICAALAFLIFGTMEYRVEASGIVKTDVLAYLPAPFDGYIKDVNVRVGSSVKKAAPLMSLDTRELLLEESNAIANQNRYAVESEKARAQNALADMKVARALEAQAKTRLKLVRYRLEHAQVRAPFDGIVVEGDLEEMLGAPVRKGDILLKVALIEKMFVELKVNERDIHEITLDRAGEIAFVSRPDLKFPVRVQRIDPVAVAEEDGNVFLVRAEFKGDIEPWWRPGMSGVAKINAGRRNLLWVLTHRTVDFLRILLWW